MIRFYNLVKDTILLIVRIQVRNCTKTLVKMKIDVFWRGKIIYV